MQKQKILIKSSDFQCIHDYVLVKPEKEPSETISEGGIVMLTGKKSAIDRPTSGVIISFGLEAKECRLGLFVAWPSTDGIDIEFNDGEFVLLREKSILGYKINSEELEQ